MQEVEQASARQELGDDGQVWVLYARPQKLHSREGLWVSTTQPLRAMCSYNSPGNPGVEQAHEPPLSNHIHACLVVWADLVLPIQALSSHYPKLYLPQH